MNASRFARAVAAGLALSMAAGLAQAAPLKVGYLPVTGHAKFFVAQEHGLFKEEGLEVELVEFVNSADGLNAVVAGKLDLGAFGTTAPLVHYARGAELKIIGGVMGEDAAIVVKAEHADRIRTVADLKGKKVATVRLATGDAVLRAALKDARVDWKEEVEIAELKNPPAVIEAVKSGQVDAGVVWGPHDLRAERQGLKVVIRSGELQPGHPCCRLVVKADRVQEADTWKRFLRAMLKAERFAATQRQATLDAIQKYVKLDRDILEAGYYSPHLEQGTDPNVAGTSKFWTTLVSSGFIEGSRALAPIFELSLYREALASLAGEQPDESYWKELVAAEKQRNAL